MFGSVLSEQHARFLPHLHVLGVPISCAVSHQAPIRGQTPSQETATVFPVSHLATTRALDLEFFRGRSEGEEPANGTREDYVHILHWIKKKNKTLSIFSHYCNCSPDLFTDGNMTRDFTSLKSLSQHILQERGPSRTAQQPMSFTQRWFFSFTELLNTS